MCVDAYTTDDIELMWSETSVYYKKEKESGDSPKFAVVKITKDECTSSTTTGLVNNNISLSISMHSIISHLCEFLLFLHRYL